MEAALAAVRAQLGREYDLIIAGERFRTDAKLTSVNPARTAEVVGVHQKATPELAMRAVETAFHNFPRGAELLPRTASEWRCAPPR